MFQLLFKLLWLNVLILCFLVGRSQYEPNKFQRNTKKRSSKLYNNLFRNTPKAQAKALRLQRLVSLIVSKTFIPREFSVLDNSTRHNSSADFAILTTGMSPEVMPRNVKIFAGTLRKYGYAGDIVIGILPYTRQSIYPHLRKYNVITYHVNVSSKLESKHTYIYSLYGQTPYYTVNVNRYILYKWWAMKYSSRTQILVADFRDVFFQSNPFTYRTFEWAPPVAQLVVFQESHPNSVISRCTYNSMWIHLCYGVEALRLIGHNTVSCSGLTMGTRDAILAYVSIQAIIITFLCVLNRAL